MNWIQKISADRRQRDNLALFLDQYDVSDLGRALQIYKNMYRTYICKSKNCVSRLNIYDIYYLEIQGHNITVYTQQGTYLKYGSLTRELKLLEPYGFFKCTQSCIVSLNKIRTVQSSSITLVNNVRLHMSRKYAREIIIACSQNKFREEECPGEEPIV